MDYPFKLQIILYYNRYHFVFTRIFNAYVCMYYLCTMYVLQTYSIQICYLLKINALLYYRQKVLQIGKKWSDLRSNWNSDDGYRNETFIPWKIESMDEWNSVEFVLAQKDSFYGCSNKDGFTVKNIKSNWCCFAVHG